MDVAHRQVPVFYEARQCIPASEAVVQRFGRGRVIGDLLPVEQHPFVQGIEQRFALCCRRLGYPANTAYLVNPDRRRQSVEWTCAASLLLDCACLLHICSGIKNIFQVSIGSQLLTFKEKFVLIYQHLIQTGCYQICSYDPFVLKAFKMKMAFRVGMCG